MKKEWEERKRERGDRQGKQALPAAGCECCLCPCDRHVPHAAWGQGCATTEDRDVPHAA